MNYKRVGIQLGLATFVAVTAWTVGPNAVEAAPAVKPIVSTASFKANLKDSFLVADDTDGLTTKITTDRLNVRSGPSTSEHILGVLNTGTEVRGVSQGDWFKITYNGQTAYVHADWLRGGSAPAAKQEEAAPAPAADETVTRYTTANLNVRKGQSTSTAILGVLPRGSEVTGAYRGEWFQVSYNGQTAFVHTDYLRKGEAAPAAQAESNATGDEAMTTTAYLNVRTGPSTQNRILGVLTPGTTVEGSSEGGWFKITYAGQTAYASKAYLTGGGSAVSAPAATPAAEQNRETVKRYATASVNVRSGPGTGYRILGVLKPGHEISGHTGSGWFETTYNGETAYVSQSYLSASAPQAAAAPAERSSASAQSSQSSSATINAIVADAWAQVGKRYVYGAAGPNSFDCSGLTYWLYNKHAGIKLPRSSASQASAGTSVSRSNMQAGDLIFFINPGASRVGHVAIYVGNGQYVHASTPSSGVKVDRTSGSYFQNNAVSIKRILP